MGAASDTFSSPFGAVPEDCSSKTSVVRVYVIAQSRDAAVRAGKGVHASTVFFCTCASNHLRRREKKLLQSVRQCSSETVHIHFGINVMACAKHALLQVVDGLSPEANLSCPGLSSSDP